jgi:hypothetical protein
MGVKWEDMSKFMQHVILHCQKFASGYVVYCSRCRNPSSYEDYHYCTPCDNLTEFTGIPSKMTDQWNLMTKEGVSIESAKERILEMIMEELKA